MSSNTLPPVSTGLVLIENNPAPKQIVRVGAYCRVSTKMETQRKSLETQMAAYERIIQEHPGWELADIYADQGLSGTCVRKRTEFLHMPSKLRSQTGEIEH